MYLANVAVVHQSGDRLLEGIRTGVSSRSVSSCWMYVALFIDIVARRYYWSRRPDWSSHWL